MARVQQGVTVFVGTKKGLFMFSSTDRKRWKLDGPHFEGFEVMDARLDPRDRRTVWAAPLSMHWGPTIAWKGRAASSWKRSDTGPRYEEKSDLSVSRVWTVVPGIDDGVVYAGVDPAGLFRSDDDGKSWASVDGLNFRGNREGWFPGGGGLALHTILPHPTDAKRMVVGISAAGVFETRDGGRTWNARNGDVRADFLPEKKTKEDQLPSCPHKVARDAALPDALFQQNHCGMYRREANAKGWTDVSRGLPSRYGFALAAHPRESGSFYAAPLEGDGNRVMKDGAMAVWHTKSAGKTWTRLSRGLPQKHAYFSVLRDALATDDADPAGVYVGTNTGHLFASRDEGKSWSEIASTLPPILSVKAAVVG